MRRPVTFSWFAKLLITIMTVVTMLAGPWAEVVLAQPAHPPGGGAGAGIPSAITADVPKLVENTYDTIITQITRALVVAFFNALQTFMGRIAYDAANYIASGGKGESAQFFKKGFGAYLEDTGKAAAGDFIGTLSASAFAKNIGMDFCKPKNPLSLLKLQFSLGNAFSGSLPGGIQGKFTRPKPKCDFQELVANWDSLAKTFTSDDTYKALMPTFDMNKSELGVTAGILNQATVKVSKSIADASKQREEGKGWKAKEGLITGNIKSPADLVAEQSKEQTVRSPSQTQTQQATTILQNAFKEGPIQLVVYTASVFLNTLTSKLLNRIFDKGMDATNLASVSLAPEAVATAGASDARAANIDIRTPNLIKVGQYEVMSDLQSCPPTNRSTWNCVVDRDLGSAINSQGEAGGMTIREALFEKKLLHGERRLIPSAMTKENQDPDCYNYAYCAGNLAKLRAMRIMPVGLEFAANSPENVDRCNSADGCITLNDVVKGFSDCNDKNQLDSQHPWCHLVDPNWVIVSPPQQCALSGFGDNLLDKSLNQRREECQDIQTCLKRNDHGECVGGYGYCLADKTAYRFNATECPSRYASCRNYADRAGTVASYLRNTLDYGACTADNVGCLWYATTRNPGAGGSEPWVGTTSTGPRVYFDKTLEPCDAADEGCTHLYAVTPRQASLNMVANPSFERAAADGKALAGWLPDGVSWQNTATLTTVAPAFNGSTAFQFGQDRLQQRLRLTPGRAFTLSFYARSAANQAAGVTARLDQYSDVSYAATAAVPDTAMAKDFRGAGCVTATAADHHVEVDMKPALSQIWTRYQCTFNSTAGVQGALLSLSGNNVLVDAVQLEEGNLAMDFVDGLNLAANPPALTETNMKVAPDEYKCTGAATDHASCAKFAPVCRQSEAGCQGYTDVTGGGPEIPAITSANDSCPASCVGYAEYRKSPSAFDLVHDADTRFDDPADATSSYFIAATAGKCTQSDAGCEEFTNVEAAAAGGESTAFYSYVRSCEKPGADSQTYFTWEGSDTAGYQLRTWSLKKDVATGGPFVQVKRAPGSTQIKEKESCNEALWRTGADPDCRQFYDADGKIYYNFMSQTVLSTDDCTAFRLNRSNQNDCTKTFGQYNPNTGECIYQVNKPGSLTCNAAAAGCRAFAGAGAGNLQTVLTQDFRNGKGDFTNGDISSEALLVGDSSLKVSAAGGVVKTSVPFASADNSLYRVTFWAKAPVVDPVKGGLDVALSIQDKAGGAPPVATGGVRVTSDWQRLQVGPFNGYRGASSTSLMWSASTQSPLFIDQVMIEKIQDLAYVRLDTWKTPAECDRSAQNVPQPQAMLGCRLYRDRDNATKPLRSFSNLCRGEVIGCKAFIDTRNSADISEQTFVMADQTPVPIYNQVNATYGPATTTRLGDRWIYLIDKPEAHCQAENASCRAFGKPNFTPDRLDLTTTTEPFTTVYFKDDITKYDQALCRPSEIFCEEFKTAGGGTEYFRDPQDHVCEYKENVQVAKDGNTVTMDGYFIKDTETPCYPNIVESGRTFNLARAGDPNYQGWAGACPAEQGECTEFRDPNDTSNPLHKTGQPYFFINNDQIDKKTCAGNVDVSRGCILLRDMGNSDLIYNVSSTYAKYRSKNYAPTPPVDCNKANKDPFCATGAVNDATDLIKVKVDRDCAQWLGCRTAETVYDTNTNKYKDLCTKLDLCDQASGKPGDIFCDHYVNRSTTTSEPILTKGAFFDINRYVSRAVGLGEKDYSGFALPDAFQVADLVNAKVAAEGAKNVPSADQRFALDYRLAAVVQIPPVVVSANGQTTPPYTYVNRPKGPKENEAVILDSSTAMGKRYPDLSLCQHVGTQIVGYYKKSDLQASFNTRMPIPCYLPILSDKTETGGQTDTYDFHKLSEKFNLLNPLSVADKLKNQKSDPYLLQAFPPAECRANPEVDSPFPADYVTEWDQAKNPPKAVAKQSGFTAANTCEFGEDCVCAYKRADYSAAAVTKFYGVYSSAIPPGICSGGPRDGQSCLPETVFKLPANADPNNPNLKATEGSNVLQTCGPPEMGGRCVAFNKVELVRGVFGQCLERDMTRTVAGDKTQHPCLTWNPTPILFGDKDSNHYNPAAGYFPPENSGQYYCVSKAAAPSTKLLSAVDFQRDNSGRDCKTAEECNSCEEYKCELRGHGCTEKYPFAGQMTYLTYNDDYVSVGSDWASDCKPYGNFHGASLLGSLPSQNGLGDQCEQADGDQGDGGNGIDSNGLRLIDAGPGEQNSYTETFFPLSGVGMPEIATGKAITYIEVSPILNPNGKGRLGCGYQADWVEGLGKIDYTEADQVAQKDKDWRDKFMEKYNPTLTKPEHYLTQPDNPGNLQPDCCGTGEKGVCNKWCAIKYWETGYNADGQVKFKANSDTLKDKGFDAIRLKTPASTGPIAEKCDSSRPYFAIRAVFVTVLKSGIDITKVKSTTLTSANWNLVGFWVSTCAGATKEERYIYMKVAINRGDICQSLAEVRSSDSRQDAAFTDRIWKDSGYVAPGVNLQYGARYAPFSSALNTGPAGSDPLFQTGGSLAGFSSLHPPTFLGAGVDTYYRDNKTSGYGRAYLSNLFARIYRIYEWNYTKEQYTFEGSCPQGWSDQYCGLLAYDITDQSTFVTTVPTDVTLGHYSPAYFGYGKPEDYSGVSYYTPRPPVLASPDTRACSSPGTCQIQRLNTFSLDGQSDGVVSAAGGQHKSTVRFYAWAAHNQMPIRRLVIDWGDGLVQELPDAKLKNHKPYCGAQNECENVAGLTCGTDADCPPGAGRCLPLGTCGKRQNITCHTNDDCAYKTLVTDTCETIKLGNCSAPRTNIVCRTADDCNTPGNVGFNCMFQQSPPTKQVCKSRPNVACTPATVAADCNTTKPVADTCNLRTFFGNNPTACETNYFELNHVYTCGGKTKTMSDCLDKPNQHPNDLATEARCQRDPSIICSSNSDCAAGDTCVASGLAPANGCFDKVSNACRFTPRILVEDNWGWCTGECRDTYSNGVMSDSSAAKALHTYGGCFSFGTTGVDIPNIRKNSYSPLATDERSECNVTNPTHNHETQRPWIVYPGSLQLGSSGEKIEEEFIPATPAPPAPPSGGGGGGGVPSGGGVGGTCPLRLMHVLGADEPGCSFDSVKCGCSSGCLFDSLNLGGTNGCIQMHVGPDEQSCTWDATKNQCPAGCELDADRHCVKGIG